MRISRSSASLARQIQLAREVSEGHCNEMMIRQQCNHIGFRYSRNVVCQNYNHNYHCSATKIYCQKNSADALNQRCIGTNVYVFFNATICQSRGENLPAGSAYSHSQLSHQVRGPLLCSLSTTLTFPCEYSISKILSFREV